MGINSRLARIGLMAAVAAGVVAGAAVPAFAGNTSIDSNDQVVLVGRVVVPAGERVDDVVMFHGPVRIEGTVTGSVTVFDGNVVINGSVNDAVTVFNGSVTLGPASHVGGDVISRERPTVAPGAQVDGKLRRFSGRPFSRTFQFAGRFVVWVAVTISTFLLGLFLVLFAPRAADAVYGAGRDRTGASIGIGFAVFFGFPVVAILALVTLVGIPLGIGLLLGIALVYWIGYTWSAWFLGRVLLRTTRHRVPPLLVGVIILRVLALVPVVGGLVWFLAAVFGLGAMTVAGRRGGRVPPVPRAPELEPAAAPATPPPPVSTIDEE